MPSLANDNNTHTTSSTSSTPSPLVSKPSLNFCSNSNSYKSMPSEITIIHFNDCYNIDSRIVEPVGGAARFKTAINSFLKEDEHALVLFSGDIFSPSIMSTLTKGEQMVPVLNQCRVDCAVFGNHEFDFGVENLVSLTNDTKFPWLMSNVIDNETNRPLAEGLVTHIIECKGKRIGLIGLVEEEWLATLSTIERDDVTYFDFVTEGRKLARQLRDKDNVDYVIALTHMRMPNDCRLAENVDDIDLILGGHDHVYEVKKVNGKYIVKSGTDFLQLSKIVLNFTSCNENMECDITNNNDNNKNNNDNSDSYIDGKETNENCTVNYTSDTNNNNNWKVEVTITEVNITSEYSEDEQLKADLHKYSLLISEKMDMVLGHFSVDLDGRFSSIRTQETNLGNFVTDIMLASTHSDLAILNSGTLRSDMIHQKGEFKLRDLVAIMPAEDPMCVISITGEQIVEALENSVSQWPRLEGRFPQVSGLRFAFDPRKPPGERVKAKYIKIGDEYLDLKQNYRLVTKLYLANGRDGYEVFKQCPILVDDEECPELPIAIQNHFEAIKILTNSAQYHTHHRQSLVCLSRRHSVVKMHELVHQSSLPIFAATTGNINNSIDIPTVPCTCNYQKLRERKQSLSDMRKRRLSVDEIEYEQCRLEPKVEGRITMITNDQVETQLEKEFKEYYESSMLNEAIPEEPEDVQM